MSQKSSDVKILTQKQITTDRKKTKQQQKKLLLSSQSQANLQKVAEYEQFFQKNANQDFGIASYVITGQKIDTDKRKRIKEEILGAKDIQNQEAVVGSNAGMQTEEAESLNETDFVFNDNEDNQDVINNNQNIMPTVEHSPKTEANLLYKGAHVKVYKPVKEIQQRNRPQTAGPNNLIKRRFDDIKSNLKSSKNLSPIKQENYNTLQQPIQDDSFQEENFQNFMHIQELNLNQIEKVDLSKLNNTFKNEYSLQQSIFRDKKQKVVELTEYLELVLNDYQRQKFKDNQQQIDQTLEKFNLTDQMINDNNNLGSLLNSKRTINNSIHEFELKKSVEDSKIQSTGLRLRRLTANYGPRVDLVSHGFQHFKVHDIEQFFDPLRLKLMIVPLSDIPNILTKQGSDFYFIKGIKLQQMKDLQAAINTYEEGITEYPNSSYNCKFNKGVLLFKLGMFKESLMIYRRISKEEPLDKRLAYNKSICEVQNGLYNQAIFTIDSYINDFNERKERFDKSSKGDVVLSYQEKIQMTKANYVPDDQYLFEIYQIRGVACLRAKKVVEASKSFQVAQEFKSLIQRKKLVSATLSAENSKINSNNQTPINGTKGSAILIENQQTVNQSKEEGEDQDEYTIVTLENTLNGSISKRSLSQNRTDRISGGVGGIRFEDQGEKQEESLQEKQFKINLNRPLTSKLQKSQSQNLLKVDHYRLETLEEENDNIYYNLEKQNERLALEQNPIIPDQQEDLFRLDADEIMRTLDGYQNEYKQIQKEINLLQTKNEGFTNKINKPQTQMGYKESLNVNRNIDQYLSEERLQQENRRKLHGMGTLKRTASDLRITNQRKNNFYFTQKNLLININKPKGAIAQFTKVNIMKEQRMMEFQQQKLVQEEEERARVELKRQQEEIEEDFIMRPEEFYIDVDNKIRLDKVLLGFEIDPLNDSITDMELEVRKKREQLEKEFQSLEEDSFYKRLDLEKRQLEVQKNKEYFLQFLQIQDKDLLDLPEKKLAQTCIKELNEMQSKIGGIRKYINQTFNDPTKTQLNLNKNHAMAQQLHSLLKQSGQKNTLSMNQSSKLLESLSTTQHSNNKMEDSVGNHFNQKKPKITKRFNLEQIQNVIDQYELPLHNRNQELLAKILSGLKFFIKFPMDVRMQLMDLAILRRFDKGQLIFNQGDRSEEFFVIVKGSVCVRVVKDELGNVPVNTRIAYDGDYIGELAYFEASDNMSPEIIEELHKQRVTTIALETPTYVLQLNKQFASRIINSPALQSKYEKRISFLRELDIFKDIDMYILLPLASNIQVKKYKMGEYIVKAGDMPEGLIIVKEGQCVVCAEKLAMRSNQPSDYARLQFKNPNIKTNPTGSSAVVYDKATLQQKNQRQHMAIKAATGDASAEAMKYYSDSLQQVNTHHKTYQNEQILVDDKGRRMKDFTVYKDLMIFFTLLPKSYFGGRVLLPVQNKKETADEKRNKPLMPDNKRRGAWFAGGHSIKGGSTTNAAENTVKQVLGDFEHLFIKRRYSFTSQKIMKNDRASMLSVIANSSEVEVYLIDQQLLEFFPEQTQKHIWAKLMHVFEPDRPYMLKNVQKIKDKFREWDVYKIKSFQDQLKERFNIRQAHKQKQVVELER